MWVRPPTRRREAGKAPLRLRLIREPVKQEHAHELGTLITVVDQQGDAAKDVRYDGVVSCLRIYTVTVIVVTVTASYVRQDEFAVPHIGLLGDQCYIYVSGGLVWRWGGKMRERRQGQERRFCHRRSKPILQRPFHAVLESALVLQSSSGRHNVWLVVI